MNTEEFVQAFFMEKENLLKTYTEDTTETQVGQLIHSLNLTEAQNKVMKQIIDKVLTDAFYTILIELDGNGSIGGIQEMYSIKTEDGSQISGEIEGYAYEYFQEND